MSCLSNRPTAHRTDARAWRGGLVSLLLVIHAATLVACGSTRSGVTVGGSGTPTGTLPDDATSVTTTTTATTPQAGSTPRATATAGHSGTPVPFQVTSVNVSVSPANFNGTCQQPMTFTFTAVIGVPAGTAGGDVTFWWIYNSSIGGPIHTITFQPGQTSRSASETYTDSAAHGQGSSFPRYAQLFVNTPNSIDSPRLYYTYVCQFKVTGLSVSGSYSWSGLVCNSPLNFTFTGTISVSPSAGGSVSYFWERTTPSGSSGTTSQMVSVPGNASSVTVTDTWSVAMTSPPGTYGDTLEVTSPNAMFSPEATVTKKC